MNDYAIKDDYATLMISRVFDADIETVFRAWTDPEMLARWFGPEGVDTSSVKVDLNTGGQYEIIMQSPEGEVRHYGEYVLIEPPEKLVFTWVLDVDNQACTGSTSQSTNTLVTVDFRRVDNATEIVLTHEQLPDRKACEGHQFGWTGCFDSLAKLLA
jgi:uncharacterized protein YndB with AHSA1/START domain